MQIIRDFSGKLNTDDSPYRLPPADYIDALNITRDSESDTGDGVVANIPGNRIVNTTLPAGTNLGHGAREDRVRNRIIDFIYNSNGEHLIRIWDRATRAFTTIFQSKTQSAGVDILNLQPLYKVKDIDIIHRDDDGDLLCWNDAYNRPGCLNIKDFLANKYGNAIPDHVIRLAKIPPTTGLTPSYASDTTVKVNLLKGKLFQFIYRWGYDNGFKSTWSPVSKAELPVDAYTVEVESDPSQNNVIYLPLTAGGVGSSTIEIAVRESSNVPGAWLDWKLIDAISLADYGIPYGGSYNYKFLNDGAYPDLDVRDTDLEFDYVPDKANSQVLANGNVLVFGGITEGYNQIKRTDVNVQLTSVLIDTNGSSSTPSNPTISYFQGVGSGRYYLNFTIGNSIGEGSTYNIKFHGPVYGGDDFDIDVTYNATIGDTKASVAVALKNLIEAQLVGTPSTVSITVGDVVTIDNFDDAPTYNDQYPYDSIVASAVPFVLRAGGTATWKHSSKYRMALLYRNEYGKVVGIASFVSNNEDPNDFSVTTPDFSIVFDNTSPNDKQPRIPVIKGSISHLPPADAVSFEWLRTPNQSVETFLQTITCDVDQSEANYVYFCIANFYKYKEDNGGFVPSYTFTPGDRIRVVGAVEENPPHDYLSQYYAEDYEIVGIVDREVIPQDGDTAAVNGAWVKVAKPSSVPTYEKLLLVELYRPALRTAEKGQVFFGFGESYPIYTVGGVKYHMGSDQNQTASQPATFTFDDGDVYYKFRNFYTKTLALADIYQRGVMDPNYSDFFSSAINSNGRAYVIEPNAKRTYNPVLRRHGQSFQQGTDINGLNRFYAEDFDEDNRDYGDIMKMISWNNRIIVFQKLKIGWLGVREQMTYNVDGSSNLILSSELLSKIHYYQGEYGVGNVPECVAYNNDAIWGWTDIRGVSWRLAQNGLTPISITGKMNAFAVREASLRGFANKIYGVYDSFTNKYISAFEAAGTSPAKTLVWNEMRNGFETFVSYHPEMMCCLNNLLVTWKNGNMYTHDNTAFNTFYGSAYESNIKLIFNDSIISKKEWNNITLQSSESWDVPQISTPIKNGTFTTQESNLVVADFEEKEGFYHAVFMRNSNAIGGVATGDPLKGAYMVAKIRKTNAINSVFLNAVIAGVTESPLNNKQ